MIGWRAWLNLRNGHRRQVQYSKESGRIMGKNIGFVSTRFAGTDGVSLEASKWAAVLAQQGYHCFWFAGELDRDPDRSLLVPEAHFKHPLIQQLHAQVCGQRSRNASITDLVHYLRSKIKRKLHNFVEHFRLDLLIVENAFAIPMNLPLGLALVEAISETQIPAIAHHHDFYWERTRYSVNAIGEYLQMAFPPSLPNIEHVVINSTARDVNRSNIKRHRYPAADSDYPAQGHRNRHRVDKISKRSVLQAGFVPRKRRRRAGIRSVVAESCLRKWCGSAIRKDISDKSLGRFQRAETALFPLAYLPPGRLHHLSQPQRGVRKRFA
jgi:hypothetical protein